MLKKIILLLVLVSTINPAFALTDIQIKQRIIKESIANYPGNCPCPYNYARNGSRCGGRSAYSRAGGYEPICYPADVTQEMVKEYRATHKK